MPDWRSSMQQTFEYYIVDPGTWKDVKLLDHVKSCTITRDSTTETLGSASLNITESLGESYVRVYLVTIQNGVKERHPLGTFLIQTPSSGFNGKIRDISVDAYTPLLELKDDPPPIGYSILKNENIMDIAYQLANEHARAPVVKTSCADELYYDFVANTNDTWLSFLRDLISNAKHNFDLDELGRILFSPRQDTASLQPVWDFDDSNSSILYPDITMEHDLYGVPNVVEIIYTNGFYDEETGLTKYHLVVSNDDVNSPISTVNRGRIIRHREVDPNISGGTGIITSSVVNNYAVSLLRSMSSLEYSVSFTHGYCPVRVGDCVRLNYTKAGLLGVKAKIISQNIKCEAGCPVTAKAVYTTKLWEG